MEDHQIVALYLHRAEKAVEETAKKYGALCHSIAYHILDSAQDAAEIVNDTYLRLWNTIPPQQPESLKAYASTVCKHLALDRYDTYRAQKRGAGQLPLVLDELAREAGMRPGALAMLMLRARKKLKKHLQKEGFEV